MRRTAARLLLASSLAELVCAQGEHTFEIRGRVVDAEGRPAANVEIGTHWSFDGEAATPRWRSSTVARPNTSLRTDGTGRFSGTLFARRRSVAVFALDMRTRHGGIFVFTRDNLAQPCTLEIGPLVHLHGETRIDETRPIDSIRYIYVTDTRARIAIASSVSKDAGFSFFMPPGVYEMSFSAKDLEKVTTTVSLKKEHGDVDLGSVALSPTNLARHYGKEPPPWNITAARGVKPDVTLADYAGKWVLIEFWAYW
jgi:hypothetical protein